MSTKISIVNVKNYDSIPDAINAGIKLIADTLPFDIRECKTILLKPNLLRATKDACTQPVFVETVLKYLKDVGVESDDIRVGDSPGQIKISAQTIAKKIGLYEVCEEAGVKFINFVNGEYPEFLRKECISCLYCMEMCPQEAIKPKKRGFGGLFHSY